MAMKVYGLNVHKSRCWVHIRNEDEILKECSISWTPEGLENFQQILHDQQVTRMVMESSNMYWIPIYRLFNPKIECRVINAYQRRLLGKHKTDEREAQDLARWSLLNVATAFLSHQFLSTNNDS